MHGAVKSVQYSTKVSTMFSSRHLLMDIPLDNNDDGETAAGNRLAHLLQILVSVILSVSMPTLTILQEVNNVLVVVTRYFGGIQLGADRFKHINQAARNALELGGFLNSGGDKKRRH